MSGSAFVPCDEIRARWAAGLHDMYVKFDPLYKFMAETVAAVDDDYYAKHPNQAKVISRERAARERHGAIRVGTPEEYRLISLLFKAMNMHPVNFYDLTEVKGNPLPIIATAHRPLTSAAMEISPMRVFTSLFYPDDLRFFESDPEIRDLALDGLAKRKIFPDELERLIHKSEAQGGLEEKDAELLAKLAVEAFSMDYGKPVDKALYDRLKAAGSDVLADIAAFPKILINHLTPGTQDIWTVHKRLLDAGLDMIELQGPEMTPDNVAVQLRQTSYRARPVPVNFASESGEIIAGEHRAPFGEIEQRGVALTPEGKARLKGKKISETYKYLPGDYAGLEREGLAFFTYHATGKAPGGKKASLASLVEDGCAEIRPIIYEDFLAASAASIFSSNLSQKTAVAEEAQGAEAKYAYLQHALGADRPILDSDELYASERARSIENLYRDLGLQKPH